MGDGRFGASQLGIVRPRDFIHEPYEYSLALRLLNHYGA